MQVLKYLVLALTSIGWQNQHTVCVCLSLCIRLFIYTVSHTRTHRRIYRLLNISELLPLLRALNRNFTCSEIPSTLFPEALEFVTKCHILQFIKWP